MTAQSGSSMIRRKRKEKHYDPSKVHGVIEMTKFT